MLDFFRKIIEKIEKITGIPLKRLIKFGIVGGSGVLVNMGIFYILNEFFLIDYSISGIIAIELSIINNFSWNHLWTWRDRKTEKTKTVVLLGFSSRWNSFLLRLVKYHMVAGISGLVNYGVLRLLVDGLVWNKYLSNLIGIGMAMAINFIINHKWTFRKEVKKTES